MIIFISIDDLLWDVYYAIGKLTGKIKVSNINVQEIENVPPKMLAILVAAYNEESVLKLVIQNLIKSNQYPNSMYHIFLGVYSNDGGTLRVAEELEAEFSNVHKIVSCIKWTKFRRQII